MTTGGRGHGNVLVGVRICNKGMEEMEGEMGRGCCVEYEISECTNLCFLRMFESERGGMGLGIMVSGYPVYNPPPSLTNSTTE